MLYRPTPSTREVKQGVTNTLEPHLAETDISWDGVLAGVDVVVLNRNITSIYQVKKFSNGTNRDLGGIAAALDRSRLQVECHLGATFGSSLSFTALHDAGQFFDFAVVHDAGRLADEWILAGSLAAASGLFSRLLKEACHRAPCEVASVWRHYFPASESPAKRPPRSTVVTDAFLALGYVDASARRDVLARSAIGVPRASTGICRTARRIDAYELCKRLQELAQFIRVVLVMWHVQHAGRLSRPTRASSAVSLYLLLATCHRYRRRAEPSGVHPSLSRLLPSVGSALVAC